MCEVCGCGDPHLISIDLHTSLLSDNDRQAAHLREHFVADGVLALNIMGSPGAGKTALIEATAQNLAGRLRLAAVSADLATALDAERLERAGVFSAPITTGSACHLDANLVHHALHDARLARAVGSADVFFIENVGNLVCPAIYDLGQSANVVVLSVTEGVDKPLKYPVMFHKANLVLVTKIDLLPHLPGFSLSALRENIARVMPKLEVIELSAITSAGVSTFVKWLDEQRQAARVRQKAL
ncbi:MAG TPA: hydrogenase nickel incorporation protein HypB [Polyangiaceae bacterium]|nr:hydrogenase nickel incorporation protein HypB [Polyangiaceae bacterium]